MLAEGAERRCITGRDECFFVQVFHGARDAEKAAWLPDEAERRRAASLDLRVVEAELT